MDVRKGHIPKGDHPWYKAFGGPRLRAERRIQRVDPHLHVGRMVALPDIWYVWDDRLDNHQIVLTSRDLKDLVRAVLESNNRPVAGKPPKDPDAPPSPKPVKEPGGGLYKSVG